MPFKNTPEELLADSLLKYSPLQCGGYPPIIFYQKAYYCCQYLTPNDIGAKCLHPFKRFLQPSSHTTSPQILSSYPLSTPVYGGINQRTLCQVPLFKNFTDKHKYKASCWGKYCVKNYHVGVIGLNGLYLRRSGVHKILRMITQVLLCSTFFSIFEVDPGSPAWKNLPARDFSRSNIVPIFWANYIRYTLVKHLIYINGRANDGTTVL